MFDKGLIDAYLIVEAKILPLARNAAGEVIFKVVQPARNGGKNTVLTTPSLVEALRKLFNMIGDEDDYGELYSGEIKFGTMVFDNDLQEIKFYQERSFRPSYEPYSTTISQDELYRYIQ